MTATAGQASEWFHGEVVAGANALVETMLATVGGAPPVEAVRDGIRLGIHAGLISTIRVLIAHGVIPGDPPETDSAVDRAATVVKFDEIMKRMAQQ